MSNSGNILCAVLGHMREYTPEYESPVTEHVRADHVCIRCGDVELAWTGPTVEQLREAGVTDILDKETAYEEAGLT